MAAVLWATFAATGAQAEALSREDYVAHRRQIQADFAADRVACERLTDSDKRVCMVKAKGRETVALAELDYNVSGTAADAARLAAARDQSDRAVARAVCAARPGVETERCANVGGVPGAGAPPDPRERSRGRP